MSARVRALIHGAGEWGAHLRPLEECAGEFATSRLVESKNLPSSEKVQSTLVEVANKIKRDFPDQALEVDEFIANFDCDAVVEEIKLASLSKQKTV